MGKRVLVLGSSCVDVIIRLDHLPVTEENMHPPEQKFQVGGCAYNVANVLGRGGADTTFVTPVGLQGVFGGFVRPLLEKQPWAKPVFLPDQQNGCCYCLVEKSGERTFLGIHGAEYSFDPAWMEPYQDQFFDFAYVCGLEVEERWGDSLIGWLEGANVGRVLYAPCPRGPHIPKERTDRLFALHPLLHLNEREARELAGKSDLQEAMGALHQRTGGALVVTRGAEGALVMDDQGRLHTLPGERVSQVADTIGAGDAHAGAVLLGLCRGLPLPDAAALANRVSAQVVQVTGATLPDDLLNEVLETLRQ